MASHEYERPWQVMPAKIIKLALDHAAKSDDFDHQVAFLLLDIGVETALKVYLENKGQDIENLGFRPLVNRVRQELSKSNSGLIKDVEETNYFHNIRNKLYHRGDGVKPTEDNLKRYSHLAKRVIEEIIEVDLETEAKRDVVNVKGRTHEIEVLVDHIETKFKYLQVSCGIVTEKVRPTYAAREFAMKLNFVLENWEDSDVYDVDHRLENRNRRLEEFNKLTQGNQTDHDFVDYILGNVNHFYVIIALQQISENWEEHWDKYVDLDERRSKLLGDWKSGIRSQRLTKEQVLEEFEKMTSWIETQQKRVDEWIDNHFENINRGWGAVTSLDIRVV